ncbi:DUF559 domain-containing protein [Leucobacter iarius]|uniref:Type IV toxin-antitoxin system AbiEi family antitoxin domain-containing protein n=1 Tax=Leucobacter iarius TaxID=333963 RepID=A0ABP4XHA9_9MICO
MHLTGFVAHHQGIVRSRDAIARGHSPHRIAQAVAAGRLSRPRKGWIALPGADPVLVEAARNTAVVSCVTRAERLGLWIPRAAEQLHFASRPNAKARGPGFVVHWAKPLLPRSPGQLEDSVENALALIASCLPYEDALVIWESALNRHLIQLPTLARLPLTGRARGLLTECRPFADSGLESLVRSRFTWLGVRILEQVRILGHRVDLLFGDRLVVQIDGGTHVGPQRDADNRHDALLMLQGYRVIRVSYAQIVHRWEEVHDLIVGAIARGEHLAQ